MTLKKRFALIFTGILIFCIIAPSAVFFALGYRLDTNTLKISRTGTLQVQSEPRGASVFINQEKKGKTPHTTRFLLPGEYEIEIDLPGYYPWHDLITIHEGQAIDLTGTNFEKIHLIKKNGTTTEHQQNIQNIFVSENISYTLTNETTDTGTNSIKVDKINLDGKITTIATANGIYPNAQILDAVSDEIILTSSNTVTYLSQNTISTLPNIYQKYRLGIKPETVLAINPDNSLIEMNLEGEIITVLLEQVSDYSIHNNNIYALSSKNGTELIKINPAGESITIAKQVPSHSNSKIIVSNTGEAYLLLDQSLYQVAENSLEKINNSSQFASLSSSGSALLFGNENELWIFNPNKLTQQTLVLRQTQKFGKSFYNDETGLIFTTTKNKVIAISTASKNKINVYELYQSDEDVEILKISKTKIFFVSDNTLFSLEIN